MKYSQQEVMQFVEQEDVKFIRLAFCDVFGKQKNLSVMPGELARVFEYGAGLDASAVDGFAMGARSDLFLMPDPSTLSVLLWRPEHGRVVRMYCSVHSPDGSLHPCDMRSRLEKTVERAAERGVRFAFGPEMEFYLFKRDENGERTSIPYDNAGYMDIAPQDKGENVRREICLTLEQMGIAPESSHHEEGPGQNEIDFRYCDPVAAADNAVTFRAVVNTIAARSGLYADFSPKPLTGRPGSGMHINFSVHGQEQMESAMAGILARITEMTLFLNPERDSYLRFGSDKAPQYVCWGRENRSVLLRVPAARGEYRRAELRSPDPQCNPYLALLLLMEAAMEGIEQNKRLPEETSIDLMAASAEQTAHLTHLPASVEEAAAAAQGSEFIRSLLPQALIESYISG